MSEKLRETLLTEAQVTDQDRRWAAMAANGFVQEMENALAINQQVRKQYGPMLGRELKKAETDLKKVIMFMKDAIRHQMKKGGPPPRSKL